MHFARGFIEIDAGLGLADLGGIDDALLRLLGQRQIIGFELADRFLHQRRADLHQLVVQFA
ncbi:hypothetical protein D3C72_2204860 [compost metagenome]